jgi:hypothetical protein
MSKKVVVVISSMVIGLVVTAELIGSGRTLVFLRCQWWHATHEPELRFRGIQVRLPPNWFPFEQEETPMLSMIPSSRSSRFVMLLLSPSSDHDRNHLMSGTNFPRVMTVLGNTMTLESGPSQLEVGGMPVTRFHYVAEDNTTGGESFLIWVFPVQDVSASSYKIHRADIEHLDHLISTFTPYQSH